MATATKSIAQLQWHDRRVGGKASVEIEYPMEKIDAKQCESCEGSEDNGRAQGVVPFHLHEAR